MKDREFKDAMYDGLSKLLKALSNPYRLEIIEILSQGEKSVEGIVRITNLSFANASQHLQVLRGARLVESEKRGQYVIYRITDEAVCKFLLSMRLLAEREFAEVEQLKRRFLEGKEGMEPVNRDSLIQRVKEGTVIVLDVRPAEEYQAGHIPGAISIPLKELEQRLSELPRDQEIAAYCRGPYCVLAVQAVQVLRSKGFHAFRMEEGVQDWRARGFPVTP